MGLKEAWAALCGVQEVKLDAALKRRHEPMFVRGGTQRAKIIEAMSRGEWTGAFDACRIIKSHKGETRFGDVIRLLRRAGIDTIQREVKARSGEMFKQYQILPSYRSTALKLIKGKEA